MDIKPTNNQINFGWSCSTHKKIMETALKDFPQFADYKDEFCKFVQRPDYDDIGILANKHFYFTPELKGLKISKEIKEKGKLKSVSGINDVYKKIFKDNTRHLNIVDSAKTEKSTGINGTLKKIFTSSPDNTSFMDFSGKNNAKYAYKTHVEQMNSELSNGNKNAVIEQAARALHFLQDMTQSQHIENMSVFGKATDFKIHNDFEDYVADNEDKFIKDDNSSEFEGKDFNDTFEKTYNTTLKSNSITRANEYKWDKISTEQMNLALSATKDFLNKLSEKFNNMFA